MKKYREIWGCFVSVKLRSLLILVQCVCLSAKMFDFCVLKGTIRLKMDIEITPDNKLATKNFHQILITVTYKA